MMPSSADWPVPWRSLNARSVNASLTATIGQASVPAGLERAEPDEARGGLLRAAEQPLEQVGPRRVDRGDEVGAVVERHLRAARDHRRDPRRPRVHVLAVDGVHLRLAVGDQRRGDVVLRGERVGRAQRDLRPAGPQRPHEVRRLRRDVQARADRDALQRPLGGEALADRAQDRHLRVGPLDPGPALGGQTRIGDITHRRPRMAGPVVRPAAGCPQGDSIGPSRPAA